MNGILTAKEDQVDLGGVKSCPGTGRRHDRRGSLKASSPSVTVIGVGR
jgi:hypothetical protein